MIDRLRAAAGDLSASFDRGPAHRRRLEQIDATVVVSGTAWASTTVRLVGQVARARGRDALALTAGDEPAWLRDGQRRPLEGGRAGRLEEIERTLREDGAPEVLVAENPASEDAANRACTAHFLDPDVVVLTGVDRIAPSPLARRREAVARCLARSVPAGTPAVVAERDEGVREVLATELDRRGCPATFVDVPPAHDVVPGAEVVHAMSPALEAAGLSELHQHTTKRLLDEMDVEWTQLPDGLAYDAAWVGDVGSTEAIRRRLADRAGPTVQPLVCLDADRRAQAAAFCSYLGELADAETISKARAIGDRTAAFARKAPVPVVEHAPDESGEAVLEAALADDRPVLVMGNGTTAHARDLRSVLAARAGQRGPGPTAAPREDPEEAWEAVADAE